MIRDFFKKREITVESESYLKVIFALCIVWAHLPKTEIMDLFTYLFVAGFFFMSGYGLESRLETAKKGYKYDFFRSACKILVPFYIAQLVFFIIFDTPATFNVFISRFIKEVFLLEVNLPYGWYVRTQFVLYVVWWIVYRIEKKEYRLLCSLALTIVYVIISTWTDQLFTSYKTVFAFVMGIAYRQYEIYLEKYTANILVCVAAFYAAQKIGYYGFTVAKAGTITALSAMNLSGIMFCIAMLFILYRIRLDWAPIRWLVPFSYEIYLSQGIAYSTVAVTPFADRTVLDINNGYIILTTTLIITIIYAVGLKKISELCLKKIIRN